jgi:hypothetical protein
MYYHEPEELDDLLGRMCADRPFSARLRRNAAAIACGHSYQLRAAAMMAELGLS